MNLQELDILKELSKQSYIDPVILSVTSQYSVDEVDTSLNELIRKGLINHDYTLTDLGIKELEKKHPKNAIILAAGSGTSMVPINTDLPKGLLNVCGQVLIERIIQQLQQVGINEIHIVVGFMAEKFEYLKDKYGVNLIYNEDFALNDSLHSLNLAKEKLGNSYIVPSDIYCQYNPFSKRELYSWYMLSDARDNKSIFKLNQDEELLILDEGEEGNTMLGIAYILDRKAEELKDNFENLSLNPDYMNKIWEELLIKEERVLVSPHMDSSLNITGIDSYEQLRKLDPNSPNLESEVISLITSLFNTEPEEIKNIILLKRGMTNHTFKFEFKNKDYLARIPGEGTGQIIDRKEEYQVYQLLMDMDISDKVLYFNPDNGFRITEFWEDARVCDPKNIEDVTLCMDKLKALHGLKFQVDHHFDLFEKINYYESLRKGQSSIHPDYMEVKDKVHELYQYVEGLPKEEVLSHIDSVPNNFLLIEDGVRIIDWEYSGMQDPHLDIAMFATSSGYSKKELDRLMDIYFSQGYTSQIKIKIYSYVALCGFLWSNWSEYKILLGVELGDYPFIQYSYAKKFYKIAKEEMEKEKVK